MGGGKGSQGANVWIWVKAVGYPQAGSDGEDQGLMGLRGCDQLVVGSGKRELVSGSGDWVIGIPFIPIGKLEVEVCWWGWRFT